MGALAFVGDFGSTKTLAATAWLQDGVDKGITAVSNFGFTNGLTFRTTDDLVALVARQIRIPFRDRPYMRVVFDEAGVLFPCRGASRFPPAMELVCNEARKMKMEIAYCVPNLSRVDLNVRLATSRVVRCKGFFYKKVEHEEYGLITRPRVACWTEYEYADDKQGDRVGRTWRPWRKLAAYKDLYDSWFMIESVAFALEAALGRSEEGDWGDAGTPPVVGSGALPVAVAGGVGALLGGIVGHSKG